MQCLNKDNPGKDVDWRKLFKEDKDFNQSEFVEELRLQHVQEREEYLNELENEIIENDADNDGTVSLEEVHGVVKYIDPQKPHKDTDKMLSTAFGCPEEQLQPAVDDAGRRVYNAQMSAPIADIMKRLRASIVRRHSKRKAVREQQNQNSIVKIMQNIENGELPDQDS